MRNAGENLRRQEFDGAAKVSNEGGGGRATGHRARTNGEANRRVSKMLSYNNKTITNVAAVDVRTYVPFQVYE